MQEEISPPGDAGGETEKRRNGRWQEEIDEGS